MASTLSFLVVSFAIISTIIGQTPDIDALHRSNDELKETIIQMWSSLNSRLDVLDARLSCISNCSAPEITSTTTITPTVPMEQKIYQNLTIDEKWTVLYDKPYSHPTTTAELLNASNACSGQILIGARRNANDSQVALGAVGPSQIIQYETTLNTPLKIGEVYWYRTSRKSFGFSPNITINQDSADTSSSSSELRLSWHLESAGGYRVGSVKNLNSDTIWRKVIYCLN